jgi:proline iminopeptidase
MTQRLAFFPEISPYAQGRLRVSGLHEIYYEECGNPHGKPVVVLHGGPGSGISPFLRRLHNPAKYRIILFDQRGCGASTPYASLEENTTHDLVADMEKLRRHLNIERWQVVGGSWGSTLALAYAQAHVPHVSELIVRGIFTVREREVRWFYQEGASFLFPEAWEDYVKPIPVNERHDLVGAYYKRLTGDDEAEKIKCARAWSQWEGSTLSLLPDATRVEQFGDAQFAIAFGRIECHYFVNRGFFPADDYLLANAHLLRDVPGVIIQGRYDVVTPPETAYLLSKAWPTARFEMILDAGHTGTEPGIADALVRATNGFLKSPFLAAESQS